MKKLLSVTLSVLMVALLLVPAFAAGGHTVTFTQPSNTLKAQSAGYENLEPYFKENPYVFAKVENNAIKYVQQNNGPYVFYDNRFMTLDNIYESYWDQVPPERYVPDAYTSSVTVADNETLVFTVSTSPVYNAATVTVLVNGTKLDADPYGLYKLQVKSDITIRVMENNETGELGLQRNLFNVKLVSGDGFAAKAPMGESYKGTYYGDDFYFRVKVKKGYSASGMKVSVLRDVTENMDFMSEFDTVTNLMGMSEPLTSYGLDEEGCRLYKVSNVTTDCRLVITGVREEKTANVLTMILRVLRKILDLLGIKIQFVDDMTDEFKVTVNNTLANASYNFLSGTANEDGSLTVMSGSGITLQVIKENEDQDVRVSWAPGNENGEFITNWVGKRDPQTGETVFVGTFNIDNIRGDTLVTIQ